MKRLRGFALSNRTAGWIDQILVSATNFVLLLALARWSSIADVGYSAIAASIVACAVAVQDALATRPYTILFLNSDIDPGRRAAGTLISSVFISAILSCGAVLVGSLLYYAQGPHAGADLAFVLGFVVPAALFRDFARRHCFAHLRSWLAVAVDMTSLLLACAGIVALGTTGHLNAITAISTLGLANITAFATWFIVRRRDFIGGWRGLMKTLKENVALGKWLLAGQLATQAQGYTTHWITLVIGGVASTGLYSGCLSIVALSNPFLFGYFNTLTPQFVRVLKQDGPGALRRHALWASLLISLVLTAFTLAILIFGNTLMQVMLPGESFREGTGVLVVLALANLAGALGGAASVALTVAEKGRSLAYISFSAFVVGSALVCVLMVGWGLYVAAYGILLMEAAVSLARWVMLALCLPNASTTIPTHITPQPRSKGYL